jgi:ubiquinone/menaquinone biosynthesis C-methylase UbiE
MTGNRPLLTAEEVWRRYDAVESRLTAPVSERMLDLAGLQPGMRVLDLATGRGEPSLRAARRVGPQGLVLGVELSDALLRMAKEKADREGLSNLDLRSANAELLEDIPRGHFHAATVRWGLMYMAAPIAALANARRALLPTGVLVAALWAEPNRVPYFTLPRRLLERYRRLPALDPEAPGTFRYADLERVVRDFNRAGFTLEHVEEMEIPVFEAETGAELVAWVRALGLTQLLNDLPEDDQRAWEKDLTSEMERSRAGGLIRLGGVTRIVCARSM